MYNGEVSMRKIVGFWFAGIACLVLFAAFIVFHLMVIFGALPSSIVWGGRLETHSEVVRFELISALIMLICAGFVLLRLKFVSVGKMATLTQIMMWLLVVMFLLNTLGNIFAESLFERLAFTPITVLLAFFSLRLALGKKA